MLQYCVTLWMRWVGCSHNGQSEGGNEIRSFAIVGFLGLSFAFAWIHAVFAVVAGISNAVREWGHRHRACGHSLTNNPMLPTLFLVKARQEEQEWKVATWQC
jgi:hypothetical protein